jgi:hypothetical protein
MPLRFYRRASGWLGLLGVLAISLCSLGCPGTLDPSLLGLLDGGGSGATGGSSAKGGKGATGGASATGGSGGAAGGGCTNGGADLVTNSCVSIGCHDSLTVEAGLDLTPNSSVGSRLIGVKSTGASASACGGFATPYLVAGSNPATGLLINKISLSNGNAGLCGDAMPYPGVTLLSANQQTCIEQWAEGLITAAP